MLAELPKQREKRGLVDRAFLVTETRQAEQNLEKVSEQIEKLSKSDNLKGMDWLEVVALGVKHLEAYAAWRNFQEQKLRREYGAAAWGLGILVMGMGVILANTVGR